MRIAIYLLASVAAVMGISTAATAAVTVSVQQSGANVVSTATGTLDLTGLTKYSPTNVDAFGVSSAFPYLVSGSTGRARIYEKVGTAAFGSGNTFLASTSSGTIFGFYLQGFLVDTSYIDNSILSSSMTFNGSTLANLGLTPGTYNYMLGSNAVTLMIGNEVAAGVPEPATWAMMIAGFGLVGGTMRRRKTTVATRVRFA